MKALINAGILFFLCVLLSGCLPIIGVEMLDNTGSRITIGPMVELPGHNTIQLENGEKKGIQLSLQFYVKHDKEISRYAYTYPPHHFPKVFYQKLRFNTYLLTFQIQADGSVYLVPGDQKGVLNNFSSQPEGFPLKPLGNN